MADKNRDEELPQRVKGAARLSPARPAPASALSDELRQRMRAAVDAERAETRERAGQPGQPAVASPPAAADEGGAAATNGRTGPVNGRDKGSGKPPAGAAVQGRRLPASGPAVRSEPAVDDEPTEWLRPAVETQAGAARAEAARAEAARAEAARAEAARAEAARAEAAPAADTSPVASRGHTAPPAPGTKTRRRHPARRVWLAVLAAVALMTAVLAVVAVPHLTHHPASSAAQLRQQAAARDRAAAWVARQVSRNVTVSCDQAMCRALSARGFPARDLLVLGPTSSEPDHSDVVVETAVVQGLFGSSLATAWAPDVLASFGSGAAAITVRVVARHGAASYQAALRADQADRKTAGAALLGDRRITMSAAARRQLAAGQVDARLILAIASLAAARPVDIVQFGDPGPGADPGIPLRYADLAEDDQAAHMNGAVYVQAMRAALDKLTGLYRPASTVTMAQAGEPVVLRVEVTAPSPLGLLGPQASP
jgi:hypothetical protein